MNRWRVVVGGVLMNLALGSLYAWSVFVAPLEKEFGWTRAETSLVFTIAVVTFAITFIFGGRLQDRRGPRSAALIGAVLVSLGFLLTSATSSLTYLYLVFGVIVGAGNGFGYATPIPVASKWFPDKRGLVVGIMVGGYGAGSAIIGSLATAPDRVDRLARDVPDTWRRVSRHGRDGCLPDVEPAGRVSARRLDAAGGRGLAARHDDPRDPAHAAVLPAVGGVLPRHDGRAHDHQSARPAGAQRRLGATAAAYALTVGAFGNAGGRILSGWLSDSLGRLATLRTMVLISAIAMPVLFAVRDQVALFYLAVAVVYWCYGTQLSVFASTTADFYGTRNLGANYGRSSPRGARRASLARSSRAACSTRRRVTSTRSMPPRFSRSARSARC